MKHYVAVSRSRRDHCSRSTPNVFVNLRRLLSLQVFCHVRKFEMMKSNLGWQGMKWTWESIPSAACACKKLSHQIFHCHLQNKELLKFMTYLEIGLIWEQTSLTSSEMERFYTKSIRWLQQWKRFYHSQLHHINLLTSISQFRVMPVYDHNPLIPKGGPPAPIGTRGLRSWVTTPIPVLFERHVVSPENVP